MAFAWLALWIALSTSQSTPQSQAPTMAELRTRLATYEKLVETKKEDPAELAAIATAVVSRVETSNDLDALIQACSSRFVVDDTACRPRLWAIAKRTQATLAHRASAAAALARKKDKDATEFLFALLKPLTPAQLLGVDVTIDALPPARALPLLEAMLTGGSNEQIAACRILGTIDDFESRRLLGNVLQGEDRMTEDRFACTIARAQLGDQNALQMVRYTHSYMRGANLVAAGALLVKTDQELGVSLLQQAIRQSRDEWTLLEAADVVAPYRRESALDVLRFMFTRSSPAVLAGTLELHRNLGLDPDRDVRAYLLHANPLVQLRAGEAVLAWAERRKAARPAPPGALRY
jgi:hypothetical protein